MHSETLRETKREAKKEKVYEHTLCVKLSSSHLLDYTSKEIHYVGIQRKVFDHKQH